MTNTRKTYFRKKKNENYFKKAKEIDVRARSYFKLEQIDLKYNLINDNLNILDLGCAPGGWLEYIDKKVKKANIIGIDLIPIKNKKEFSENITIIEDDFDNISNYTNDKFDLIISDMAPEFSGKSTLDRGRTHKLNIKTIEYCKEHLKEGGNLIFKSFEGEDLEYVRKLAKKAFKEVHELKPKSSQKKSAEIFEICISKKK